LLLSHKNHNIYSVLCAIAVVKKAFRSTARFKKLLLLRFVYVLFIAARRQMSQA
jgi:hypothetical protein